MAKKKTEQNAVDAGTNPGRETVRFNLYLPKDAYEALERLQELTGKRSLAETIRSALKLYHVVQQGIDEGKDIMLVDRASKEKERLVPM
jgi:hypothetical protein